VTVHAERPIPPQDKTRELQRKLYRVAKRQRNRKFHALYDRIFRSDILRQAWEEVRRNGGSAGQDGVSIEDVETINFSHAMVGPKSWYLLFNKSKTFFFTSACNR
jgi:hypothetical protein